MSYKKSDTEIEIETELKIKLSPADLEKVFTTLLARAGNPEVSHKRRPRMYFDTSEMDLYRGNISLRIQAKTSDPKQFEQTVKIEMNSKSSLGTAVMLRKECRDDLGFSCKPDMSVVGDKDARSALKPFRKKQLKHIFTAAIDRRYFDINLRNGKKRGTIEVAFDVGEITLAEGGVSQKFFEIEVEVKEGGAGFIELVKNEILAIAPSARVQPLSKAMQGSQLYMQYASGRAPKAI